MASAGAGATEPRRSGTADTAGSVDMLRQAAGRAVDSGVDAALRAIQLETNVVEEQRQFIAGIQEQHAQVARSADMIDQFDEQVKRKYQEVSDCLLEVDALEAVVKELEGSIDLLEAASRDVEKQARAL